MTGHFAGLLGETLKGTDSLPGVQGRASRICLQLVGRESAFHRMAVVLFGGGKLEFGTHW